MPKRKGIIYAALERLDGLMALGESRYQAKQAKRAQGETVWAFSSERIHSLTTRTVYQQHVLAFINWARGHFHVNRLEQLDEQADELASRYLEEHLSAGRSPFTLQTERSALRLFFGKRDLAARVKLPPRQRQAIRRSRGPTTSDREFQPLNWQREIAFLQACGLRRVEARKLRIFDIIRHTNGLAVFVRQGKGGRARLVPVLPGREQQILCLVEGRGPEEHVFTRLPVRLDVHALRREYAQTLYLIHAPGRELPSAFERLKSDDYDEAAVMIVSQALGHNRIDVVLRYYLI